MQENTHLKRRQAVLEAWRTRGRRSHGSPLLGRWTGQGEREGRGSWFSSSGIPRRQTEVNECSAPRLAKKNLISQQEIPVLESSVRGWSHNSQQQLQSVWKRSHRAEEHMLTSDPRWLVFLWYTCWREFQRALPSVQQNTGAWVRIPAQLYCSGVIFASLWARKHSRTDDGPFLLADLYLCIPIGFIQVYCVLVFITLLSVFLPSLTISIVPVPLLSDFSLLLFPLYSYTSLCIFLPSPLIPIHFPKRLPFHSHVLGTCLILGISRRSKTNKSNKACAVCLSESDFGNLLLKGWKYSEVR